MKYKKLLSYSQDFVSFLIFNLKEELLKEVEKVILFGSVSKYEATKRSDVDLFIEVKSKGKEVEGDTDRIIDKFYESPKFTKYWKLLGIDNPISCKFGKAAEWKDLYPSIIQDGIVLYGKYKPEVLEGRHFILFSWENVKPESKRVMLNRKLYGYRRKGKNYPGLLPQYDAKRVSKGSILVPLEHRRTFEKLFRSYKIPVKIYPLLEVI